MTEGRPATPVAPLFRPSPNRPVEERVAAIEPLVELHEQRLNNHDQRFRENDLARHELTSDVADVQQRQTTLEGVAKSLDGRLSRLEQAMESLTLIARHLKSWYAVGTVLAIVGGAVLNSHLNSQLGPAPVVSVDPPAAVTTQR